MRIVTRTVVALGFVGAMAVAGPSPSLAQGVYFQSPGVEFGIGRPWYRDRYYRPYAYDYGSYAYVGPRPYWDGRTYGRSQGRYWRPNRTPSWD